MSTLADKIRKARESVIEAGEFKFTIRRPTDVDMIEWTRHRDPQTLLKFVIGWDGVKEIDLIPGGDPHPAQFDSEACAEWLKDRSDLFVTVVNGITDSYQNHKKTVEDAEKK